MLITLEALEAALAPIEQVGKGESELEINGVVTTLRRLLPEEEAEVQKFASAKAGDEDTNAMDYLERYKIGTLSYAIIAIGSTDLRGIGYIDTAEVLDNGKTVRIQKHKALRTMLLNWSSIARVSLFRQYSDLITKVDMDAEKAIKFDPTNLDSEINRLKERLAELEIARDEASSSMESAAAELVRSVANEDDRRKRVKDGEEPEEHITADVTPVEPPPAPQPVVQQPKPAQPRQSAIPGAARPVQQTMVQQPKPAPVVRSSNASDYAAGMEVPDSFVNMGDSGSMDDAINAENMRMLRQRQAVARGQSVDEPPSVLTQVHSMRRPPHAVARDADEGILEETIDTRVAYTPEMLAARNNRVESMQQPQATNPRFQPPKK